MNTWKLSWVSFAVFLLCIAAAEPVIKNDSGPAIIVFLVVLVGSFVYAMYLWLAAIRFGDKRILKHGTGGTAEVTDAHETSVAMASGEYYGIGAPTVWRYDLNVTIPGKSTYSTRLYICAHLQQGDTVPIAASKLNPKRVTVDAKEYAAQQANGQAPRPARDTQWYLESGGQGKVTVAPAAQAPDVADELKKLADLRDRGALSSAEFEMEKQKLLGSR